MTYDVDVIRISQTSKTIRVENANSIKEAKSMALAKACNVVFKEGEPDYVADMVMEVK